MATKKGRKPNQATNNVPNKGPGNPLGGYEVSAVERAAAKRFNDRASAASPAPRVKVEQSLDGVKLSVDHPSEGVGQLLLCESLGTSDLDFVNGLLTQLANVARRHGKVEEAHLNFLISVVKDLKPRDQMESMLAAQMAVTS